MGVVDIRKKEPDMNDGYALEFDGDDDYVEISNDSNLVGMSELTLEAWFFTKEILSQHQRIVSIWGDSDEKAYQLFIWNDDDGGNVAFEIKTEDSSEYLNRDSSNSISTQEWHHLAGTYDGSEMKLYLNGELIDSKSITGDIKDVSNNLFIGIDNDNSNYFEGYIKNVRIWDIEKTQQEIQNNMTKELNGDETGLVAYYKINEGFDSTLNDSVSSNDGTIYGANWSENFPIDWNKGTLTDVEQRNSHLRLSRIDSIPLEVESFDNDLENWTTSGDVGTTSDDYVYSGNSALIEGAGDTSSTYIYQDKELKAGVTYRLNFWAKTEDCSIYESADDDGARIRWGAGGDEVFDDDEYNKKLSENSSWEEYSILKTPNSDGSPRLEFSAHNVDSGGKFWVDEVSIKPVYYSSGNRESSNIDLSPVNNVSNSKIEYSPAGIINFDGESGYADFGSPDEFNDLDNLTIELWAFQNSYNLGDDSWGIDKDLTAYRLWRSDRLVFGVKSNSESEWHWLGYEDNDSSNPPLKVPKVGEIYHLVGVVDNDNLELKLFLDGDLLDSKTIDSTVDFARDDDKDLSLKMACHSDLDKEYFCPITILKARIWDRALTQNEVQDFSNKVLDNNTQGLLSSWRIEEGTGSTIYDKIGNNDGTLNGDYSWGKVIIETSVDGGDTWDTCTNGDPIPNIDGASTLDIRQILETDDTTVTPVLESLTVDIDTADTNEDTGTVTSTDNVGLMEMIDEFPILIEQGSTQDIDYNLTIEIGLEEVLDFNINLEIGQIEEDSFEILLEQGSTQYTEHELELIYDVLNKSIDFPLTLEQGQTVIPVFGTYFVDDSQIIDVEDSGTGVMKIEGGLTYHLDFPIIFEIEYIKGRLLFKGKRWEQDIDDGNI